MLKVYRDGKVAVITANGFESRWYTCNQVDNLVFDPRIVWLIENDELDKIQRGVNIEDYCDRVYGERDFWGDSTDLCVTWIDTDTEFRIVYEDGWEQVVLLPSRDFKVFKA